MMTTEEKAKASSSSSNERARRIQDAFPLDDLQPMPKNKPQAVRIQSDNSIEELPFEQSEDLTVPSPTPHHQESDGMRQATASEDIQNREEPRQTVADEDIQVREKTPNTVNGEETAEAQEEQPAPSKVRVKVKKAADKKKPYQAPPSSERTEQIITIRPHAHRPARDEEKVPFKEHPLVKKSLAFAREYKKELPHNYLLFTPFLPLGVCFLLVFFRIFYAIASPTGANIYASVAVINIMAFVPLCTIYLRRRPLLLDRMGWKLPSTDKLPLIFIAALTLFFGAAALTSLGAYFGITEVRYHLYSFYDIPAATSIAGILFSTVTLAVIPALTEEILCRGIIFAEYQYDNTPLALIMSAIFSAVLQFDPSRLIVGLFCGLLLGLVRMVTNSLSASIIVHMIYNVACLFYEHFFGIMGNQLSEFLILFFLCAVFALISFFFLFSAAEKICRTYAEERKEITVDLKSSSGVALKGSLKVAFISPSLYFVLLFYFIASFFI